MSRHAPDDNALLELQLDLRRAGEDWQPLELSSTGSPFLGFLHCAFTCQLAYLRMNATERGLGLDRVFGHCRCDTEDFRIHRFLVSFSMELRRGEATEDDLAYLRERCLACPVSVNLHQVADKDTTVTVNGDPTPHP